MQSAVIIDVSSKLNLTDRIFNHSSTILMWFGWFWLLRPLFHFSLVAILSVAFLFDDAKMMATLISVAWTASLLGNSRANPLPLRSNTVECPKLTAAKDKKVCTVYHDEFGNIVDVK